jgi:hypothetical protein
VPGSTLSEGDTGIAFHGELASVRGAGAPLRGPGGASGASYGGGSSSSTGLRALASDMPVLQLGARPCEWLAVTASTPGDPNTTPSVVERAKRAPTEAAAASTCDTAAEAR